MIRGEDLLIPQKQVILTQADIIGVSAMTIDLGIVKKISRIIHQKQEENPELVQLLMIGGPITNDPKILDYVPFDIAAVGEAEETLFRLFSDPTKIPKLSTTWDKDFLDGISRIIYRMEEKSYTSTAYETPSQDWFKLSTGYPEKITEYADFTQTRISVECVRGCSNYRRTSLPLTVNNYKMQCLGAALDKLDEAACSKCRTEPFEVGFACPQNVPPGCGFCSTIFAFGPSRSRDIDFVVNEVQFLVDHGARRIGLGGPDLLDFHREDVIGQPLINPRAPLPNYNALDSFIEKLLLIPAIKHHEIQLFIENVKANLCTNEALDILAKVPNPIFSIGCETGSDEFANILGRPCLPEETLDVVERAHQRGIRVHVYFIHSLPGDNAKYAAETLALMQKFAKMNVDKITIYRFQELPGSPFYQMPRSSLQFSNADLKMFEKVKKFAIRYNEQQKTQLIGQKVTVVISEINNRNPQDAIGWILEGIPKVSVRNGSKLLDQVKTVQIVQVFSDKLVEGIIVNH